MVLDGDDLSTPVTPAERVKCLACGIWPDPDGGECGCIDGFRARVPLGVAIHCDMNNAGFQEATLTLQVDPDDPRLGDPHVDAAAYRKALAEVVASRSFDPDAEGLDDALVLLGWDVVFCERAKATFWRNPTHSEAKYRRWRSGDDRFIAWMRHVVRRDAGLKFTSRGETTWTAAFAGMLHHRETDMFRRWLDTLPGWDGHPRLGGWIEACFDTDPGDELAAWAARFVYLGAVERAYTPGAKLDEVPVLVGPQGCGKSTALRFALPEGEWGDRWFADGLDLAADDKRRAEALQGRVIVEVSEMAGSTRAEMQSLKAFLTRTDDGSIRLAYRTNPEAMPRRAVLVGTANPGEVLPNDPTGSRRFVVVKLHGGNPEYLRVYLAANRAQLWAEALALHHLGESARLPAHLYTAQADRNEDYRRRDAILEDAVETWAAKTLPGSTHTLHDIALNVGLLHPLDGVSKLNRRDQARLTAALRSARWDDVREYRDGRRVRVWQAPPLTDGTPRDIILPLEARAEDRPF